MAVFIAISTNAFEEVFASTRASGRPVASYRNVRRPLRGIEIKQDTYSIIKVITQTGEELLLTDSSANNEWGFSSSYSNFIIQGISEQRAEKKQIVETFGEDFIFFFGESPRFLNIRGVLMNTNDFNWKSEFWTNYEENLRGTKLVEKNARLYLFFDDVVVEGYVMQASADQTSQNPYHLPFQFQLFVTNYAILSNVGSVVIPERRAVSEAGMNDATTPSSLDQIKSSGNTDQLRQNAGGLSSGAGAAGGGLISFLSQVGGSGLGNTADFNIQQTLENIRNTFFGRQINVPLGVGAQIRSPLIQNQAQFNQARRGQPIYTNLDEYPESAGLTVEYDQKEIARVEKELSLSSGAALEVEARIRLAALGVISTRREVSALLVGRGAFSATKTVGSFGIRQADGELNLS